jgi:hypothetical protein
MNFNIDIDKYVNAMLPTALRKPVAKAFLKVLLSPVLAYYAIIDAYYQIKLNEIQPNLLTNVLQDYLRTLYVNTPGTNYKCWVYNQYELTYQMYLQYIGGHIAQQTTFSIGETFTQEYTYSIAEQNPVYDYILVVPIVYNTVINVAALNALVSKYKPAGKTYSITFQNVV